MTALIGTENLQIDDLDRGVIHCIQCQPRASFSRIAEVLEVSEQTVARRYRRLRSEGLLRVVGLPMTGRTVPSSWMVRIACRPDSSLALATALARRDDVGWVTVASGGAEVHASIWARNDSDRDDLLLERLPRQAHVLGVTMHAVLHHFRRPDGSDWTVPTDLVATADTRQLFFERPDRATQDPEPLVAEDGQLLQALAVDGRASVASLAAATGWSEGRAGRRLDRLCRSGSVFLDVDVAIAPLGLPVQASLWLSVEPRHLDTAGRTLVEDPQVAFVGALSGPCNLTASVLAADLGGVYSFLTTSVAAIEGIRGFEVSPALHRVKQAGTLIEGARLVSPPPSRRPVEVG